MWPFSRYIDCKSCLLCANGECLPLSCQQGYKERQGRDLLKLDFSIRILSGHLEVEHWLDYEIQLIMGNHASPDSKPQFIMVKVSSNLGHSGLELIPSSPCLS